MINKKGLSGIAILIIAVLVISAAIYGIYSYNKTKGICSPNTQLTQQQTIYLDGKISDINTFCSQAATEDTCLAKSIDDTKIDETTGSTTPITIKNICEWK